MDLTRRSVLAGGAALVGATRFSPAAAAKPPARPNILLVYLDDLGYGDLGCYGSPLIRTPHLDRLARQGARFTHGYSGAPVCTPSRVALLTGRVPARSGITDVLYPEDEQGLPLEERTVAEYLQQAGYYTAMVGKWHVGRPSDHHPSRHGFTRFFELNGVYTANTYPFDLWRDDAVVDTVDSDADLATLSRRFTDEAIAAIDAAGNNPFFVYVAEVMPHLPLAAEPADAGRSEAGLYGDVIEAVDRQLGRLVQAVADRRLDRNTLVVVASDNGPWFEGSAGGLRGRKFDVFEGGMRVPFIARWPGVVPDGKVSAEIVTVLDVLPTCCALAGVTPDATVTLDGTDLTGILGGDRGRPHPPVYYYLGAQLAAVRDGGWKLHVLRRGSDQRNLPELYDVRRDPAESYNLAGRRPDVVTRLQQLVAEHEADVRDEDARGKVRVDGLMPDRPMRPGTQHVARIAVEVVPGPGVTDAVEVTATVDVPPDWSASTVTRTLQPGVPAILEVPVTVPLGMPSGRVPTLVARVSAATTEVIGTAQAPALVAPSGILTLDAGTGTSPVYDAYAALTPAMAWDPARGYGWIGTAPQSRDRGGPDPLGRDMVTATAPAVLRIEVPAGSHEVVLLRGDPEFATTGVQVEADGAVVVPSGPGVDVDRYWWERFTLDGGLSGRTVDLRFSNTENAYWKLLALVLE